MVAVVRAGATLIVADCTPDTWDLDPTLLAARIIASTKSNMPVQIYGLLVGVDPVLEIAREHELFVVEDAADQMDKHTWVSQPARLAIVRLSSEQKCDERRRRHGPNQ